MNQLSMNAPFPNTSAPNANKKMPHRNRCGYFHGVTKVTENISCFRYTDINNGGIAMKKKACVNQKICVACGCCLTACKVGAITIPHGVYAIIDKAKCVGCGMCAKKCPASVIEMEVQTDE